MNKTRSFIDTLESRYTRNQDMVIVSNKDFKHCIRILKAMDRVVDTAEAFQVSFDRGSPITLNAINKRDDIFDALAELEVVEKQL